MPIATANGKEFEFPEGTTQEQMAEAIDEYFSSQQPQPTAERQDIYQGLSPETIQSIESRARIGRGRQFSAEAAKNLADFERFRLQNPFMAEAIESLGPIEGFAYGAKTGLKRVGRGLGLVGDEGVETERQVEKFGPGSVDVGVVAGEAAPFVPLATGIGAIPSVAGRVGASAALGAAEGGIITKGSGGNLNDALAGAGIGGAVAGALELGIPIVGRIGGKLIRRALGRQPVGRLVDDQGNYSPELISALDRSGLSVDDFNQEVVSQLTDELNVDQQLRKQFLEQQLGKGNVSQAQITRRASDFQAQQESAKTSNRVRDLLERQEEILTTRFNTAVEGTGGRAVTDRSPVVDAITAKATELDDQITGLYRQARERANTQPVVRFQNLTARLRQFEDDDRATGGAIRSIMGDLRQKGAARAGRSSGRVTVETAEKVRVGINDLYDPNQPFRNIRLRQLKEALDQDVFRSSGADIFQQARRAKADFERELNRAKISKFDRRKANVVRDILENKIDGDNFVNKVVYSKTVRAPDLQQIKDYVGDAPFNDLRAEVLDSIKNKAFIGPIDENGFKALSRDKLQKALNSIGDKKLSVLFNPGERKFLNDMLRVAELREPVRMTALGQGPSAQGIAKSIARLEERMKDFPLIGAFIKAINVDSQGRIVIKASPEALSRKGSGLTSSAALIGGSAAASEVNQE